MKLQPAVKKEIIHIISGTAVCTAIMWVVFAALALFTRVAFDGAVVYGGLLGALVAIANFVALCLTVQKVAGGDAKAAKGWMQISYNMRLLLQAVWCIVAMQCAAIHFVAAILPLMFPRITILYLQKIGAYKPEAKVDISQEVADPEGVLEDAGGGEQE